MVPRNTCSGLFLSFFCLLAYLRKFWDLPTATYLFWVASLPHLEPFYVLKYIFVFENLARGSIPKCHSQLRSALLVGWKWAGGGGGRLLNLKEINNNLILFDFVLISADIVGTIVVLIWPIQMFVIFMSFLCTHINSITLSFTQAIIYSHTHPLS